MDEKKELKISLSTFLLVLSLIAIIIMAFFIYKLNNEKIAEIEKNKNLNSQASSLQITVNQLQEKNNDINSQISKIMTPKDISGIYTYSRKLDEQTQVSYLLILYQNGTFDYDHSVHAAGGEIGNYVIDGNTIILNKLFNTFSDASIGTTSGEIKLTINDDGSISDSNKYFDLSDYNFDLSSVKLNKVSKQEETEHIRYQYSINQIIDNCYISNKASKNQSQE